MVILRRNFKRVKVRHYIYTDDPDPASYAAYLLLKRDYFRQDEHTVSQDWYMQLKFNTEFLEKQLILKGDLVCAYCGKKGLKIENPIKEFLATADHVKPKGLGGNAFDETNLCVACHKCNGDKAAKMGYRIDADMCVYERFPTELVNPEERGGH
jgi:5-methylcytosine-specific restriction endonuclease McrA